MNRSGPNEENTNGIGWGLWIHRYHEPRNWLAQLEKVPEELRPAAREYLKGIADRMRTIRRLK